MVSVWMKLSQKMVAAGLALFVGLSSFVQPVQAGYWKITYQGAGTANMTLGANSNPADGFAGAGLFENKVNSKGGALPWPNLYPRYDFWGNSTDWYYLQITGYGTGSVNLTGSVTATLRWTQYWFEKDSLPPTKVRIREGATAGGKDQQEVDLGPGSTVGPNPVTGSLQKETFYVIDNPTRSAVLHIPTRHFVAASSVDGERASLGALVTYGPYGSPTKVQLHTDSNNDGKIDHEVGILDDQDPDGDEYCEDTDERVGALVTLNEDDDNANDQEDYLDAGSENEDDLKKLWVYGGDTASADHMTLELDIPEGRENIKIWRNENKTEELTTFPCEVEVNTAYYIEGVAWGSAVIELRGQYDEGTETETDRVRVFSGILDVSLPDEVDAGSNPYFSFEGLPDGSEFEYEILKNGNVIATKSGKIESLTFVTEIDTSSSKTSPGDVYMVKVKADEGHLQLQTEPCTVVPGPPASITYTKSKPALVADEYDGMDLEIVVKDAFGNAVADGTPVEIAQVEKTGFEDLVNEETLEEAVTTNGKANVSIKAPIIGDFHIIIDAGDTEVEADIPLTDVTANLTAGSVQLLINQEQTTIVTLSTNATDGTPVYWSISNGADTDSGVRETTVNQGQSHITVSSKDAYVGDCYVTATVGGQLTFNKLQFVDTSDFWLEIDNRVLVKEQTTNVVSDVPFITPLSQNGVAYAKVPENGIATVKVHGLPDTKYKITLNGAQAAVYTMLTGLNTNGEVLTNDQGLATFQLHSKGISEPCESIQEVEIEVIEAVQPAAARAIGGPIAHVAIDPRRIVKVRLINKLTGRKIGTYSWDAFKSFFGADPDTPAGVVTSIAGGYCVVGDIGVIVKNVFRMGPWSKTKANWLELSLTGLGLLADVGDAAGGAGLAANGVINTSRVVVMKMGDGPFTRSLVDLVVDIAKLRVIRDKNSLVSATRFLKAVLSRPGVQRFANNVLHTPGAIKKALECYAKYGEAFLDGLQLASSTYGRRAGVGMLVTLSKLSADARQHLSSQDISRLVVDVAFIFSRTLKQDGTGGYTRYLGVAIEKLGVLGKLSQNYHAGNFVSDVRAVIRNAKNPGDVIKALAKFVDMKDTGSLWEFHAAAYLLRKHPNAETLFNVSREHTFQYLDPILNKLTNSEAQFDLIVQGIYYEMKAAKSSFFRRKGARGSNEEYVAQFNQVMRFAARCQADATARGETLTKIVYVMPIGQAPPEAALAAMRHLRKRKNIQVELQSIPQRY